MAIPDSEPVAIDESLANKLLGFVAPAFLLAIAIGGFIRVGGFHIGPFLLSCVGTVLLTVSLYDVPWRVVFDAVGVHRHCPIRVHTIAWDKVTALERPPKAPSPVRGAAKMIGNDIAGRPSGLVARVGPKKRYLLSGRAERPDQWDTLSSRLSLWAPHVSLPGRPLR